MLIPTFLRKWLHSLLRGLEKYTRTDMIYLFRGGFWLTAGQGMTSFLAFLLSIGFANLLVPETYGTYRYIISVGGLIAAFSLSGLSTVVTRSTARGYEGALWFSFLKNLKWSFGMMLIAGGAAIYYALQDNYLLAIGMLIVGCFSPLIDSAELYDAFLNGKKDFRTASLLRITRNAVPTIVLFIALLITKNPLLLVLVYFLAHTVTILSLSSFAPFP